MTAPLFNARSQILAIIALCGALGILNTGEIIDALQKGEVEEVRSKERVELVKAAGEIAKNARGVQAASVIALGPPRPSATKLSDALKQQAVKREE
jgi:hypothetical protein